MDQEIRLTWMGAALTALRAWFGKPRDMSGFPDAKETVTFKWVKPINTTEPIYGDGDAYIQTRPTVHAGPYWIPNQYAQPGDVFTVTAEGGTGGVGADAIGAGGGGGGGGGGYVTYIQVPTIHAATRLTGAFTTGIL